MFITLFSTTEWGRKNIYLAILIGIFCDIIFAISAIEVGKILLGK
jgi:hypothetical protein